MSVLVKICGLSEQRHVDAAVQAGADALGFVFAASPRKITPGNAAIISANVPASIKRVAVMLHPSNDDWQRVLQDFKPDVLQTDAEDFDALTVPNDIEQWPVFREGGTAPAGDSTFLYEGRNSGQGETVDWTAAAKIARQGRMILAGGLTADNVADAVSTVRPFGVDVSSAVESAPGIKDAGMIRNFVMAARAAEKNL